MQRRDIAIIGITSPSFERGGPGLEPWGGNALPFLGVGIAIPLLQALTKPPGDTRYAPGRRDHIKRAGGPNQHPAHMHPSGLQVPWTHRAHLIPGAKAM